MLCNKKKHGTGSVIENFMPASFHPCTFSGLQIFALIYVSLSAFVTTQGSSYSSTTVIKILTGNKAIHEI